MNLKASPLLAIYQPYPIGVSKAEGHYIVDENGKKYLDLFSGLGVHALGHRNQVVIENIMGQLDKYLHLSNAFVTEPTIKLAIQLRKFTFPSKIFFVNSGTEANEAALKLVRKWGKSQGKQVMLVLEDSFHGRTMGSLSLTAQPTIQKPFHPLLTDIKTLKLNDVDDLKRKVNENTCAVFVELIQGSGGIKLVNLEWLEELLRLKERYHFLIVVDEVQTGLGRTGKLFAYEHYRFIPDMVTLAKALGGGLPLGAVVIHEQLEAVFQTGDHGTTFGGNPVAAEAGLTVLNIVSHPNFLQSVQTKSKFLILHLLRLQKEFPSIIKDVRGMGLMIGVDVNQSAKTIQSLGLKEGLLLNTVGDHIIRLLPPLTITTDELLFFIERFRKILTTQAGE